MDTLQRNDAYDDDAASSITTKGSGVVVVARQPLSSSPSFVGVQRVSYDRENNLALDRSKRKRLHMDELVERVPQPGSNDDYFEEVQRHETPPQAIYLSAQCSPKEIGNNSRQTLIRRVAIAVCLGIFVVMIAVIAGVATARITIARRPKDNGNPTTSPSSPPAIDESMRACPWPDSLQDCGTEIIFSHIELTGTIPNTIKLATNATYIHIVGTLLTGSIPSELGLLTALTYLRLQSNRLTGTIPTELGLLSKLTLFDLAVNRFEGSIPVEIGALTHLTKLDLAHNIRMESSLPTEIGMLTELQKLTLHANSLTGTIPTAIGSLRNMEALLLSENYLDGTIPTEIGLLTTIQTIDFRHSSLSGSVPTEIALLSNLQVLDIAFNDLSGTLPLEFCLLNGTIFVECPIECLCCRCCIRGVRCY